MNLNDTEFFIGEEKWTALYKPMIIKLGKYIKAARIPERKQIWMSIKDKNGKNFTIEELSTNFLKAILPLVIEWAKNKYGEEEVNNAIKKYNNEI